MTPFDVEAVISAANLRASARGERLFPYQEDGVRWLAARDAALLADSPGVGKSWQCVVATPPRSPVLVVCPSAVKYPWAQTYRFLRPEFPVRMIESKASWRMPHPGQVAVCGYEVLPPALSEVVAALRALADRVGIPPPAGLRDDAEIRERFLRALVKAGASRAAPGEWSKLNRLMRARKCLTMPHAGTVLVGDEIHRCKNPDAAVTHRFRQVSRLVLSSGGRVWGVTGTPMKNRLPELWEVLQNAGLGRRAFAPSPDASAHAARGQFDIDALFPGRIAERLRSSGVMLRREREDVLPDLPDKTIEVLEVPLDADTTKLADEIVLGLRAAGVDIHTATLDALNTAALKSIPREIMSALRAKLAAAKVPAMLELVEDLEEADVPVVVFCDHLAALRHLVRRDGWAKITGEETAHEKQSAVEAFQAGKLKGVAVSIRAGGLGITLTHAWRGIFVDLPWVPADLTQAEDRLVRIGQKSSKALFTRLVAAHVLERRIEELLESKQRLFDATITAAATPGRK